MYKYVNIFYHLFSLSTVYCVSFLIKKQRTTTTAGLERRRGCKSCMGHGKPMNNFYYLFYCIERKGMDVLKKKKIQKR